MAITSVITVTTYAVFGLMKEASSGVLNFHASKVHSLLESESNGFRLVVSFHHDRLATPSILYSSKPYCDQLNLTHNTAVSFKVVNTACRQWQQRWKVKVDYISFFKSFFKTLNLQS